MRSREWDNRWNERIPAYRDRMLAKGVTDDCLDRGFVRAVERARWRGVRGDHDTGTVMQRLAAGVPFVQIAREVQSRQGGGVHYLTYRVKEINRRAIRDMAVSVFEECSG